ncbi:VanZ family protein [Bacillus carboniphilus]|uniref:VanZ family protein n=1 Tax=Bacillus carboniphilus TaxID=86663 RepID=A0ABY9JQG0_9BACI|nr:VanZ family protein [Bacillus carboniphilus]WLR41621.1 VanZ family protein [Bacillus carboniphilus]
MLYLRKIVITTLPFIYMLLIWYLSSHPSDAIVQTPFSFDSFFKESLHLIEFAILYFLFIWAYSYYRPITNKVQLLFASLAIIYGLIDEIHQSFVPSRSATLIDFVKDTIGVVVCWWILRKSKLFK